MEKLVDELERLIKGEVKTDKQIRRRYSRDSSIYEIMPEAIVYPQSASDIKSIVEFVNKYKQQYPTLSITPRAAGTDMSGAAIGNSLLLDMTTHFTSIHTVSDSILHVEPGVYIRDIDPLLNERGLMLGCIPASRNLVTIGGMVANNAAGEQSLRYGNVDKSIREVKAVLSDGNEYTFKPLNKKELSVKMAQQNFEGKLYRSVYELIEKNYDHIRNARPRTSKNSMGYNLWSVWDRETGIFDMTQLLTGSQGTLGVITDIKIAPVKKAAHSGLLIAYIHHAKLLDQIIPLVMTHKPATFEGFDDVTFNLGIKYFNTFRKQLGIKEWIKQQAMLLESVAKLRGHIPGIVLMVEFEGDTYEEVNNKIISLDTDLKNHHHKIRTEIEGNEERSAPFWNIRRASFSLLKQKVHGKFAASFMDDMAVRPKHIPEFLPEVRKIIKKYRFPATISGHFGDGNFHIIPLIDIADRKEFLKLEPAMRELIPIILRYGGTMAGEHNDGMIRGPWLPAQFGQEMYELFKDVKELFDPLYIFNPHKKTDASWDFNMMNLRQNTEE